VNYKCIHIGKRKVKTYVLIFRFIYIHMLIWIFQIANIIMELLMQISTLDRKNTVNMFIIILRYKEHNSEDRI